MTFKPVVLSSIEMNSPTLRYDNLRLPYHRKCFYALLLLFFEKRITKTLSNILDIVLFLIILHL